jgi:hypothetical protein
MSLPLRALAVLTDILQRRLRRAHVGRHHHAPKAEVSINPRQPPVETGGKTLIDCASIAALPNAPSLLYGRGGCDALSAVNDGASQFNVAAQPSAVSLMAERVLVSMASV